nr:hypothetical protein [Defluviicoccus vanus]
MRWIRTKVLTISGLAAALAIALAIGFGNAAAAAAAPACTAGLVPYTMVNHCAYPLWIGVSAGDATQSYPPVNGRQDPAYPLTDGRWQLALGGGSAQICAPGPGVPPASGRGPAAASIPPVTSPASPANAVAPVRWTAAPARHNSRATIRRRCSR